eukprot:CAMPEP_0116032412 /NCGR_PEP_ID=MMETSP0321-20121206/18153_1 /TAXON_ID=163516 /ORGANISM="Leptocylindrus danicus var. danicus, Strain B650" /LENGTH=332 /DNA_ID=CAMNT_0003507841 /DNA_START=212 /DNA_END=1210 /DNA_ORIENTATION=-
MRNSLPMPPPLPPKLKLGSSLSDSGQKHVHVSDRSAALLLTSLTEIASKEIDRNCHALDDSCGTPTTSHSSQTLRIRTISMDKPDDQASSHVEDSAIDLVRRAFLGVGSGRAKREILPKNNSDEPVVVGDEFRGAVVSDSSTPNSPLQLGVKCTPASSKKRKDMSSSSRSKQGPVVRSSDRKRSCKSRGRKPLAATSNEAAGTGTSVGGTRTILRRKFSWKNFPELEAFLIANREEYLRHSALNYTVQQKQYNNMLTERLLELAAHHGYVFDERDFSFVTIRDRIRCYYKSYVQSSKKRGVIIGYAARRAGLLTKDDLEKSASKAGEVVIPA